MVVNGRPCYAGAITSQWLPALCRGRPGAAMPQSPAPVPDASRGRFAITSAPRD
jgi:hypothetical protein